MRPADRYNAPVHRVLIAAAAYLATACGPAGDDTVVTTRADDSPRRLMIVGWDGASFRMIDRLIEEGRLPNAAALLERGSSAVLESTIIPISSAAWTSAVTGKGPGKTGVYTFFEPVPNTYDVRLISSRSNRAAPIWRILTQRGVRSIVFGVPITFPPEPISGTMVAGMLSPFGGDYTWPPEYADTLRERGFVPDLDVWREIREVGWENLDRQLELKRQVLTELLSQDDWRFAMIVFKSLDVVAHSSLETDFHDHVGPVYDRLDRVLGELVELVGQDTNVLLISDHGFNSYETGFNLHRWLLSESYSAQRAEADTVEVRVEDPLDRRERYVILQLRGELDWSRTRAFAVQSEGNFGAIRLNVAGREPEGIVNPAGADELLSNIEAALRRVRTDEGTQLVTNVFRGADLYPGPYVAIVPDLLFEVRDTAQVFSDISEESILGRLRSLEPDHDRYGILIGAGPDIEARSTRATAQIRDIAPTALHLLGQPVYSEMEGRVLTDLIRGTSPPVFVREADDPRASDAQADGTRPFTADELIELERRLRALGYAD